MGVGLITHYIDIDQYHIHIADLKGFRNTRLEGLYLITLASFNILGNETRGNLLVVAK